MLFIFETMLVALFRWIHLASDHRFVLGLVSTWFVNNSVQIGIRENDHPNIQEYKLDGFMF